MNSFGRLFRVGLFGESHGPVIGVTIDGVPPGIELNPDSFREELTRRAGGKKGMTQRVESDQVTILSGLYNGQTTGAPLTMVVENRRAEPNSYINFSKHPRPGHADFVAINKYGESADLRGGGHFSGRVTAALVIAGVVAKKIISPIKLESRVVTVGGKERWDTLLDEAIERGDSLGGVVECVGDNIPIGLGEPFFDSVESLLSHLLFSIPGVRGVEFGDGFSAASMWGSQHNDPIISSDGRCSKNGAGGVNGVITNGNQLLFRVAFKPTPSISLKQETLNFESGEKEPLIVEGRHDVAFVLRTPVIVEAAAAILLADLLLQSR